MRGARSYPGESTTTNNVRTAVWDTKHRKSSRRRRQPASTQLSERQGTQTPSLAPRAPPSRLKPRMEEQKAVVFLRERIWGAGHTRIDSHSKTDLPNVRQQEPVVVKRAPLCRRRVSLRIQPLSFDGRDVTSRTFLEDVVDSQHLIFLKFSPVLNISQVFHRLIVVPW